MSAICENCPKWDSACWAKGRCRLTGYPTRFNDTCDEHPDKETTEDE
jgi:hypothetical protein